MDQATNYYPFERSFEHVNVAQNRYLYNGKELQDQAIGGTPFGWYDYGARFYDPEIARWHSVDPLMEDAPDWSPFRFCFNNPVNFLDLDGCFEAGWIGRTDNITGWIDPKNGSLPYWDPKINSEEDFKKYGKPGEKDLGQEGVLGIDPQTGRAIYGNPDGTTSLLCFGIEEVTISAPYPSDHARTMANPIVQEIHRTQREYPIGMWIMSFATAAQASKNILQSAIQLMFKASKSETNIFGKEIASVKPRMGRDGKAVEVTFKDGSKIDINAVRVKEWTPNTHPNAPAGTLQKIKFDNSLPGTKGYKRTPTRDEIDFLNSNF